MSSHSQKLSNWHHFTNCHGVNFMSWSNRIVLMNLFPGAIVCCPGMELIFAHGAQQVQFFSGVFIAGKNKPGCFCINMASCNLGLIVRSDRDSSLDGFQVNVQAAKGEIWFSCGILIVVPNGVIRAIHSKGLVKNDFTNLSDMAHI